MYGLLWPVRDSLIGTEISNHFAPVFLTALVAVQDIKLFINSPGGSVTAGMGIYDAMQVR